MSTPSRGAGSARPHSAPAGPQHGGSTAARSDGRVVAGRYRLGEQLGRGAMGTVWEAHDDLLDRPVAVKEVVLPRGMPEHEREVACQRTLREARAIARLDHPNVVTLYDVIDEDTRPWVVMELVPSRSLAEVVRRDGPLPPRRVATIGLAMLGALEAAHDAGITHRDVKPSNILLTDDGRVKLSDFGIARGTDDSTITGTGMIVGSPSYIPPEVIQGGQSGPPADLWALGATLFTALEGRPPFDAGDPMTTLHAVVSEPTPVAGQAGPLAPVIDGLLAKDRDARLGAVPARRMLLDVVRGDERRAAPPADADATTALRPPVDPAATTQLTGYAADPPHDRAADPTGDRAADPSDDQDTASWPALRGIEPSAQPAPGRRGRRTAAALLIVLALCAATVYGGYWLSGRLTGHSQARNTAPPTQPSRSSGTNAGGGTKKTAGTPATYTSYRDGSGFTVAVPKGWQPSTKRPGVVDLRAPAGDRFLRLISGPHSAGSPVNGFFAAERDFADSHSDYHRVRIEPVSYRSYQAADWEFTYSKDGVIRHVRYRSFDTGSGSYGIYVSAPQARYPATLPAFDKALGTFAAG